TTPNGEVAAMARRAPARTGIALAALAMASVAQAGDRALFDALGYSPDGRYFAFEEYGVQDGSGFPYSNIYVIDLVDDVWVGGSPFRVRIDADGAPQQAARQDAREAA